MTDQPLDPVDFDPVAAAHTAPDPLADDDPGDPAATDTGDIAAVPADQHCDDPDATDNEDADDALDDVSDDDGEIFDFSDGGE